MILVDFSQIAISTLNAEMGRQLSAFDESNVPLLKYMVLNSLRQYNVKFRKEYGKMVICCDSRSWRKDVFPHYKGIRHADREESSTNWKLIFGALDELKDGLREFFPYPIVATQGAEADDIIGVLAAHGEREVDDNALFSTAGGVLILSGDNDFLQLQRYPGVVQFSPLFKKFLKPEVSWEKTLREHIVQGDKGDGVPNMRSPDDIFMIRGRQSSITKDYLDRWSTLPEETLFINATESEKRNFKRNKQLVDLSATPSEIKDEILHEYVQASYKAVANGRRHIMKYLIDKKLAGLVKNLEDF